MATPTKTEIIGSLILLVFATYLMISLQGSQVRMRIDNDKSTFYILEGSTWRVAGREYTKLYNGTRLVRRFNVSSIKTEYTIDNLLNVTRTTRFGRGDILIKETWVFDPNSTNVEDFPIDHQIKCINCNDLILQYEIRDLDYDGPTQEITSPFTLGKLKITWQDGAYLSKIYSSRKIWIRYKVTEDDAIYNVRLFDPPAYTGAYAHFSPADIKVDTGEVDFYCNTTLGGNVYYEWDIKKNNVTVQNSSNAREWCYQETANKSTACGGLDTGSYTIAGAFSATYPATNCINEYWGILPLADTLCTHGSGDGYIYVNYTIPENTTEAFVIWRQNTETIQGNFTPARCLNRSDLYLRYKSDDSEEVLEIDCMLDSGAYTPVTADDAPAAWSEEGVFWHIPKTLSYSETGETNVYSLGLEALVSTTTNSESANDYFINFDGNQITYVKLNEWGDNLTFTCVAYNSTDTTDVSNSFEDMADYNPGYLEFDIGGLYIIDTLPISETSFVAVFGNGTALYWEYINTTFDGITNPIMSGPINMNSNFSIGALDPEIGPVSTDSVDSDTFVIAWTSANQNTYVQTFNLDGTNESPVVQVAAAGDAADVGCGVAASPNGAQIGVTHAIDNGQDFYIAIYNYTAATGNLSLHKYTLIIGSSSGQGTALPLETLDDDTMLSLCKIGSYEYLSRISFSTGVVTKTELTTHASAYDGQGKDLFVYNSTSYGYVYLPANTSIYSDDPDGTIVGFYNGRGWVYNRLDSDSIYENFLVDAKIGINRLGKMGVFWHRGSSGTTRAFFLIDERLQKYYDEYWALTADISSYNIKSVVGGHNISLCNNNFVVSYKQPTGENIIYLRDEFYDLWDGTCLNPSVSNPITNLTNSTGLINDTVVINVSAFEGSQLFADSIIGEITYPNGTRVNNSFSYYNLDTGTCIPTDSYTCELCSPENACGSCSGCSLINQTYNYLADTFSRSLIYYAHTEINNWELSGFSLGTSATYCTNDAFDTCIMGGNGVNATALYMTPFNTERCAAGTFNLSFKMYDVGVDADEYLYLVVKNSTGAWNSIEISNGTAANGVKTTDLGAEYQYSGFEFYFRAIDLDASEYYYIDDVYVTCGAELCSGVLDCQTYNDNKTGCDACNSCSWYQDKPEWYFNFTDTLQVGTYNVSLFVINSTSGKSSSISSTLNFTILEEDLCLYIGSGDWIIPLEENCTLLDTDVSGDITWSGSSGWAICNGQINCTNLNEPTENGTLYINSTCDIRITG